jgi:hypothetical protein
MAYMCHVLYDFRDSVIVEMRAIECPGAPNMGFERYQRGPLKGRARPPIIFEHGTCHLFKWSAADVALPA